jgi:hypothetical protein
MSKKTSEEKTEPAVTVAPEPVFRIERKLGGFDIFALVADAPAYRRARERIEKVVDDFLRPYQEARQPMHKTDCSRVCTALSVQVRAFDVTLAQPFTIKAS